MYQSAYQEYVDNEILTADPIRLVQMMYRGALDGVKAARKALAAGDINGRSQQISKASAILNEMALTLDHSKAPELCRNLVELYDYMCRRLVEANIQQVEAPLTEVERLLTDLLEAWQQAEGAETVEPVLAGTYAAGPGASYGAESTSEYGRFSYAY